MSKYLLVLMPLAAWLTSCSEIAPQLESSPGAPPVTVSVTAVAIQQRPSAYEATGTVQARSTATISSKWMGYVREVRVQAGDRVSQGQLLIVLDARDLDTSASRAAAAREEVRGAIPEADSAVSAAKSNLDLAQVTFRRMSELYSKKSISDQEFDEASAKQKAAQATYDMAQAKRKQLDSKLAQADEEVRAAQVTRSYAEITAPIAGLVTVKSVDPGNLATPGVPLLSIEGDAYRLEVAVAESKLPAIRIGQPVSVTLDGIGAIAARVSEILPAVDPASRAATVRIDLPPAPALRFGVFGRASFTFGSHAVTEIPASSVIERGQLQSVFVAENGMAHTRLITVGDKFDSHAEVLSGLAAGEKIIFPVPQNLTDGTPIQVKP